MHVYINLPTYLSYSLEARSRRGGLSYLSYLPTYVPTKVGNPKVRFLWSTIGVNLAQRIALDLQPTPVSTDGSGGERGRYTQRDVVVLGTGHWDLGR